MKKLFCMALLCLCVMSSKKAYTQDQDLLQQVSKDKPKKELVDNAFKSTRVIMSQSMEMLRPGVLDFRILHRFGQVNGGAYEFFGLDGPATVRLGLDYGICNDLTVGIGHSAFNKELDGFLKYRVIQQSTGPGSVPFSLLIVGGTTFTTLKKSDALWPKYFSSRSAYYAQAIIGRKFSTGFSLQLMPVLLHRDEVPNINDPKNIFATGIGGRLKLSKRISLTADYYYVSNKVRSIKIYNPLSVGIDIETGGHVFQLHFTNAKGMNERAFLAATEYSWGKGDIFFGFNISRSFQIKKKKTN